jgi:hypothetical protein
MYPSLIVKRLELDIEVFYPYKSILSILPRWSLSDPEDALMREKGLYV